MAGPDIRAVGVDRMVRTMRTAESRLAALEDGDDAAQIALEAIRPLIPSKSGRARGSARVAPVEDAPGVLVGVVYAAPLNWGWPARGITGVHYLEHGAAAAEPAIEQHLDTTAQQILSTVKGA